MRKVVNLVLVFGFALAAPREGFITSERAQDAVVAVLNSLKSQAVLDHVHLLDRTFRLGFGSFNGQTDLWGGSLRGLSSVTVIDLASEIKDTFQAVLEATNLSLEYKANVTFGQQSETCIMQTTIHSIELVIELHSDASDQLAITNAEARRMSDLEVKFVGLQTFQPQADLLSRLFSSGFRYDIEDELVGVLEDIIDDLVYDHNLNGS